MSISQTFLNLFWLHFFYFSYFTFLILRFIYLNLKDLYKILIQNLVFKFLSNWNIWSISWKSKANWNQKNSLKTIKITVINSNCSRYLTAQYVLWNFHLVNKLWDVVMYFIMDVLNKTQSIDLNVQFAKPASMYFSHNYVRQV